MENKTEGMTNFELALEVMDLKRQTQENKEDIKAMKPIVYDTANSVKQIEKSVDKMEKNSDRIKGYIQAGVISGILGIVFLALKSIL